jgi:hypothetical protein
MGTISLTGRYNKVCPISLPRFLIGSIEKVIENNSICFFVDIYSYLDYLKITFPDFVTVTDIGTSTEGRPIKAVRLHQNGGRTNKKSILIDAGKDITRVDQCFASDGF